VSDFVNFLRPALHGSNDPPRNKLSSSLIPGKDPVPDANVFDRPPGQVSHCDSGLRNKTVPALEVAPGQADEHGRVAGERPLPLDGQEHAVYVEQLAVGPDRFLGRLIVHLEWDHVSSS
jgi:hypothetical protein